jgi:hypothetical protein
MLFIIVKNNFFLYFTSIIVTIFVIYFRFIRRTSYSNHHLKCNNYHFLSGDFIDTNADWYVCLDFLNSKLKHHACNVLSFGYKTSLLFDIEMNHKFDCNVYSFDLEPKNLNKTFDNSIVINISPSWKLTKLKLTGNQNEIINQNNYNWTDTIDNLIEMNNLKHKIIDILKFEYSELSVFENLNINYACKYFRQLLIKLNGNLNIMEIYLKLDECFYFSYSIKEYENNVKFDLKITNKLYFLNKNLIY